MVLLQVTGREKKRIKITVPGTNCNTSRSQYDVNRIRLSCKK